MTERRSYGKVQRTLELPYLLQDQQESYNWLISDGLPRLFTEISPIESEGKDNLQLELVDPQVREAHHSERECKDKNLSYQAPLRVTGRLLDDGELIKEDEIYLADIPLLTDRGTFIINGSENVLVNQLNIAPGVYFTQEAPTEYRAQVRPEAGSWLELVLDTKRGRLMAHLDRKATVPATTLLKAFGIETADIMARFSFPVEVSSEALEPYTGYRLSEAIEADGETVLKAGEEIQPESIEAIEEAGVESIRLIDPYVQTSLEEDKAVDQTGALQVIYRKMRSTDRAALRTMQEYFASLYSDPDHYNLSQVGRFMVNKKLGLDAEETDTVLHADEIALMHDYLLQAPQNEGILDDKDHLANKRVKTPGETTADALRSGLRRMARITADRLNKYNPDDEEPLRNLVMSRVVQGGVNKLFYTGRMSQYLEQTNPLSELTHKRRLSALGGGMSKQRAKLEVRDVHTSHYGRICPIETPEGQNIGLITSMASYARINRYGFLETPYWRVEDGVVSDEVDWLMADEEQQYRIAAATTPMDEEGTLTGERVEIRTGEEELREVDPQDVDYVEVSPAALVGVSASLIPFLESDDANRALMGANMQRQAVPLVKAQAPDVGTGLERAAARDSGRILLAQDDGVVSYVDAEQIVIDGETQGEHTYELRIFENSNQDSLLHQHPIVTRGDHVQAGEVIADAESTDQGELALGTNALVAFLPYEGYNYEDAIVINERMVKDDLMDSIHIQEFEVRAEETKLGPEEITNDIPDISREELRNLDDTGVIREGTEVRTGDVLVGKLTPRGESEPTPEERIFRSIFGEKTRAVRNTSKTMPPVSEGCKVIRVKKFSRDAGDELEAGVNELVKVYVAQRKKIAVGDKLAGRHGNKGVIARVLPEEDMPYLPDGTPVDALVNPLSVPSRMNIGQVFETHLGWLAHLRGESTASPIFDGADEDTILTELHEARKEHGLAEGDGVENPEGGPDGKVVLRDGRTGEPYDHTVAVGTMQLLKLEHIADEKVHARSTGPYSLITQQPLGGKARLGGQRLGEMEVWALEAYGAAHTLQEMLTLKSDDPQGRVRLYKSILKGEEYPDPGLPESFRVLAKELQSLGLSFKGYDRDGREIDIG